MKFSRIFLISLLLISNNSYAAQEQVKYYLKQDEVKKFYEEFFSEDYYKKFPEIVKKDDPYYDPDVELSIAELRKKYPLNWVEKKYGKIPEDYCRDSEYPGEVKKYPNLVCKFVPQHQGYDRIGEFEKLVSRKDFSESEIKSAFVGVFDTKEETRPSDVISIVVLYFLNTEEGELSDADKKLKSFIFSPKILPYLVRNSDSWTIFDLAKSDLLFSKPYYQDLVFLTILQIGSNIYQCEGREMGTFCKVVDHYNNIYPIKTISGAGVTLRYDVDIKVLNSERINSEPEITENFKERFLTTQLTKK